MNRLIKNKEVLIIAIILLSQIIAECLHLPFAGDVRKGIFWTNYRLLHLGLLPSLLIYYFFQTREGKHLSFTLVIYNAIVLLMEEYAIFIDKQLIIKLNQFWYSEFILIFISLTLKYIWGHIINGFGIHRFIYSWFLYILSILQRRSKG